MSTEEISTNALTVTPDSGEIVRRFMDAALVQQDPTAVDNYFAADVIFVAIVPDSLELTAIVPWYGTRHSPAGVKEVYALLLTNLELLALSPRWRSVLARTPQCLAGSASDRSSPESLSTASGRSALLRESGGRPRLAISAGTQPPPRGAPGLSASRPTA
jgi:hypothetical protein